MRGGAPDGFIIELIAHYNNTTPPTCHGLPDYLFWLLLGFYLCWAHAQPRQNRAPQSPRLGSAPTKLAGLVVRQHDGIGEWRS